MHDMSKIKSKNNFKGKRWTSSLEAAEVKDVFLMKDFNIRVTRERSDGIDERLEWRSEKNSKNHGGVWLFRLLD